MTHRYVVWSNSVELVLKSDEERELAYHLKDECHQSNKKLRKSINICSTPVFRWYWLLPVCGKGELSSSSDVVVLKLHGELHQSRSFCYLGTPLLFMLMGCGFVVNSYAYAKCSCLYCYTVAVYLWFDGGFGNLLHCMLSFFCNLLHMSV